MPQCRGPSEAFRRCIANRGWTHDVRTEAAKTQRALFSIETLLRQPIEEHSNFRERQPEHVCFPYTAALVIDRRPTTAKKPAGPTVAS